MNILLSIFDFWVTIWLNTFYDDIFVIYYVENISLITVAYFRLYTIYAEIT